MQVIIIIRGLTGAGKTTLLNKITETFDFQKYEVDDFKRKKYNTTESFNTLTDLPVVGKLAKEIVDNGNNLVIEETFTDLNHIELFKQGFTDLDKHQVIYIYLKCSVETAIERKKDVIRISTINSAYKELADPIDGQFEFNTDEFSIDQIINEISKKL